MAKIFATLVFINGNDREKNQSSDICLAKGDPVTIKARLL